MYLDDLDFVIRTSAVVPEGAEEYAAKIDAAKLWDFLNDRSDLHFAYPPGGDVGKPVLKIQRGPGDRPEEFARWVEAVRKSGITEWSEIVVESNWHTTPVQRIKGEGC